MWSMISPSSKTTVSQSFHWHSTGAGVSLEGVTSPLIAGLPMGLHPGLGTVALTETGVQERDVSGVTGIRPLVPVTRGSNSAISLV